MSLCPGTYGSRTMSTNKLYKIGSFLSNITDNTISMLNTFLTENLVQNIWNFSELFFARRNTSVMLQSILQFSIFYFCINIAAWNCLISPANSMLALEYSCLLECIWKIVLKLKLSAVWILCTSSSVAKSSVWMQGRVKSQKVGGEKHFQVCASNSNHTSRKAICECCWEIVRVHVGSHHNSSISLLQHTRTAMEDSGDTHVILGNSIWSYYQGMPLKSKISDWRSTECRWG